MSGMGACFPLRGTQGRPIFRNQASLAGNEKALGEPDSPCTGSGNQVS